MHALNISTQRLLHPRDSGCSACFHAIVTGTHAARFVTHNNDASCFQGLDFTPSRRPGDPRDSQSTCETATLKILTKRNAVDGAKFWSIIFSPKGMGLRAVDLKRYSWQKFHPHLVVRRRFLPARRGVGPAGTTPWR